MTEDVGEAVIRIRYDDGGFNPSAAGQQGGKAYASGFSGGIKGLAGVLGGALAAAGVGTFLKGAITGASDLQETVSKTEVVFDKAAQSILDFADTGAAALGLSKQAALDAAGTFGVLGKAAGLTGGDLSAFSTDLTSLSVDLASFHNADPEEVIEALGAALRGEAEPMRRFGVLLDDASLRNEALAQGLIKTTKEALTPQQKTLAAQSLIMKQTADAQGDFARTSGGLANQQRILGAQFTDLQSTLGRALLPVVLEAVKGLNGMFDSAAQLGPVIDRVGDALTSAFAGGGGGGFLASLSAQARELLPIFQEVAAQIGPALASIGSSLATNLIPVLMEFGQMVVTDIVPAVATLVGYVVSNLVPVFLDVVNIITSQVIPTLAAVADFFYNELYPAIFNIVTAVAENLKPVFDTLVEVFTDSVLPAIESMVEKIRTELLPALEPIITTVVSVIGFLYKLASAILGFVLPPLIRLAGFIIANVLPAVVSIITVIANLIGALINVGKAIGGAIGWFARIVSTMTSFATRTVSSVVTAIATLPGKLIALGPKLLQAGKSVIGKFIEGLKGAGGLVSDIAGNVWDALKGLLNNAIDKINGALEFKVSVLGKDIGINPPNIPHLQSGTRSFAGGFADVGEVGPERVYLPEGARVLTAAQTRQDGGGGQMDPVAYANAVAAALAPLLAAMRPVQFSLPSGDPEAAALATIDRLALV